MVRLHRSGVSQVKIAEKLDDIRESCGTCCGAWVSSSRQHRSRQANDCGSISLAGWPLARSSMWHHVVRA